MKLLLDECVPRKLKFLLTRDGHECETVRDVGLSSKTNGELLRLADGRFDVLVTIDKNIRYPQNLTGRSIAVMILDVRSNDISDISPLIPDALAALKSIGPGQIVQVGKV
jgi:predicted nuclease of predicted toxin-antitoxin system